MTTKHSARWQDAVARMDEVLSDEDLVAIRKDPEAWARDIGVQKTMSTNVARFWMLLAEYVQISRRHRDETPPAA